jgi:hypothetical protein
MVNSKFCETSKKILSNVIGKVDTFCLYQYITCTLNEEDSTKFLVRNFKCIDACANKASPISTIYIATFVLCGTAFEHMCIKHGGIPICYKEIKLLIFTSIVRFK